MCHSFYLTPMEAIRCGLEHQKAMDNAYAQHIIMLLCLACRFKFGGFR